MIGKDAGAYWQEVSERFEEQWETIQDQVQQASQERFGSTAGQWLSDSDSKTNKATS